MKVLFIEPVTPPEIFRVQMSQGIGYLSAVLKKENHETALICPHSFDRKLISEKIEYFNPDLVAASSVTDQFELCKNILEFIYGKYKLPIILGGIHATVAPEEAIKINGIVGIVIGEGEETLVEFVNALEKKEGYHGIRNFWFRNNGKIIKNPLRPLINDLDALPFPDRELFNEIVSTKDEIEFMCSRGCPFQCTYCVNRVIMGKYKDNGSFVRYRSVKNVIREMKEVLKSYKTERILLHDDTFTLKKEWLSEFCREYSREIKLPFVANGRVETINEDIVKMLKKAGCMELKIGVEAGNDYIRTKVLKRNMSKKQIIDAFRLCDKYGIKTSSFNMIGIPFETEENIKETIALNRKIKPYIMGVSVFRPYPGTELYDICRKNKWISKRKINSYFEDVSILNLPTLSPKKIAYYHKIFKLDVYYPAAAVFVKILLKLGLYGLFTKTAIGTRKLAAGMLTRRQKDFLMKFIKF